MTAAPIRPFLEDVQVLRSVLDSVAAGIAVCDERGNLVCFNVEAERILAMGSYAVGPEDWSSLYGCYRPDGLTPFLPEQFPLVRALAGEEVQHELMLIRLSIGRSPGSFTGANRPSVQ